ncbi:MAG: T9SS type A sorting domain-containing protein [Bacteroidota bacterium]|nr:T9SS type A sorting domain-containing protein [Bacteroidota bacterium]
MKTKILLFSILFTKIISAQNWSYVGNSSVTGNTVATQAYGSAKTVFKSDGTPISVSFGSNPSKILPKSYNGTTWLDLGVITTTGTVGAFDLEIYNNEPYIAYLETGALKVKKYDGANWINVGSNLPGYSSSLNFDFAIDNAGVLYVACFDRKIFKYNGTAWTLIYTLPQTAGTINYIYYFTGDNTLTFNATNDLVYNVTSNKSLSPIYKQFVKKYDGATEFIVGDTIIYNTGFTSYGPKIYSNSLNETFAFFHKATSNNVVVKKYNGSNWITYGDTLNFRKNFAQSSLAFTSPNSFIISGSGLARTIYSCNGQNSGFQMIDTLNVTGLMNFAQITDLGVNPINNEIYATFNSFPVSIQDYSVMKHTPLVTGIYNQSRTLQELSLYPNPCSDFLNIKITNLELYTIDIFDNTGKLIKKIKGNNSSQIDVSDIERGLYIVRVYLEDGSISNSKFVKQ